MPIAPRRPLGRRWRSRTFCASTPMPTVGRIGSRPSNSGSWNCRRAGLLDHPPFEIGQLARHQPSSPSMAIRPRRPRNCAAKVTANRTMYRPFSISRPATSTPARKMIVAPPAATPAATRASAVRRSRKSMARDVADTTTENMKPNRFQHQCPSPRTRPTPRSERP